MRTNYTLRGNAYLSSKRDVPPKTWCAFTTTADKEDMFDLVTYQKGGAIVQMLRTYLGDDVFFAGLQKYLTDNKFGNGEAQQMRLAMEAVSGQDLNWFYNQWYYGAGSPTVTIDYNWDAARKVQSVTLKQTQAGQVFQLPLAIDYYVKGKAQRQRVLMTQASQTFTMPLAAQPELVNVDAEKNLLWQKTDNKPLAASLYQYGHAPLFVDRREALDAALAQQTTDPAARAVVVAALHDKYYVLRAAAARSLKLDNADVAKAAAPTLRQLAATDPDTHVRATALVALGKMKDQQDEKILLAGLDNQSYTVQAAALTALNSLNPKEAQARAKTLANTDSRVLSAVVTSIDAAGGGTAGWPALRDKVAHASPNELSTVLSALFSYLGSTADLPSFREGVGQLKDIGIKYKPQGAGEGIIQVLQQLKTQKESQPIGAQAGPIIDKAVADIQAAK